MRLVQSWLIASYNGFVHDVDVAADYREILAANVRSARTRRHITQTSLARRMTRLGYRWHFQTVGAVERGERRLAADELLGLSVALETPMSVLVYRSPQDEELVSLPSGLRVALPEARRRPDEPASLLWDGDDAPKITYGEEIDAKDQDS
jgi:transcriptional regulator with XRE-family HTH domain